MNTYFRPLLSVFERYAWNRCCKMGTFVSEVNHITGKVEWIFRDDKYDYQQEIARSSYADMLHDTERNQLYYKALEKAVAKRRKDNVPVNVLDIGTGTGLLSMMAAKLGADTVYACEAFTPMADCARNIIKENGFENKIKLIPKRSTDVTVGPDKDMPQRANILVTEVFDTELIGEGAIGTFTHAHRHLLEEGCIVVPSVGNLYVQPVMSDLVRRWNQVDDLDLDDGGRVTSPGSIRNCGGAPSLHDLQLDQLPEDTFTTLTEPLRVFRFDFSGKTDLPFDNTSIVDAVAMASGRVDAVFMWWDLEMDEEGEIILSCAPRWGHPTPSNMQWRDHWMQAIYYPYNQLTVTKGNRLKVVSKHDEYSLWFDVAMETSKDVSPEARPVCTCGAHIALSRSRLGMLSDPDRRALYVRTLEENITPTTVCLCISDGSLLPCIAARLGARHVYVLEPNTLCKRVVCEFIKHNNLQDSVTVLEATAQELTDEDIMRKINLVIGEPVFQSAILPWDNLCYWYSLHQIPASLLAPGADTLLGIMVVYAIPVHYKDLWKIRADVGTCEGFNLQQFDKLIQHTSDLVDECVEPQPLWEYPCTAAGSQQRLVCVDLSTPPASTPPTQQEICLTVQRDKLCNGVAMWADFDFSFGHVTTSEDVQPIRNEEQTFGDHVISTGPRQPIRIGEQIEWDYYSRQGVHLFYNNSKNDTTGITDSVVRVSVNFTPENGKFSFKFRPSWSL